MNDPLVTVRDENPADFRPIRTIVSAAFKREDEAELIEVLRQRAAIACSLVATIEDQIVGHILFSPAQIRSDAGEKTIVALGPLAVAPGYQRRGIGGKLVREGLARCRAMGYDLVIVLGHPDYYPRFGFKPAGSFGIRWEHDAPADAFMIAELVPGALDGVSGIAYYQPEFSLV